MKHLILISICFYSNTIYLSNSKAEHLTIEYCNKFIGKSIKEFLGDSLVKNYNSLTFLDGRPFVLDRVSISFDSLTKLYVYIDSFRYTSRFDHNMDRKISDLNNEIISRIELCKNDTCISTNKE